MNLAVAYLVAAVLGGLVGAVEIFQRYRSEPFRAVWNPWGGAYIAFNGFVAGIGFFIAIRAEGLISERSSLELLRWAALAAFSSSALLRAKLMTIRLSDGKEVALGPELIIQTLLTVLDRELDRYRARHRFDTVHRLFATVDFDRAKLRLPLQVFQAMQTITEEESARLMKRIAEVDQMKTIDARDKSFLLGFYLLDLVGVEFLDGVLSRHGDEFTASPPSPTPAGQDPG